MKKDLSKQRDDKKKAHMKRFREGYYKPKNFAPKENRLEVPKYKKPKPSEENPFTNI